MKLNPKQVDNVFWLGVYGIVQGNRVVGFCLNIPFHTKKNVSTSNSCQLWQILCFVLQVPLNLNCLPNSVVVSMRLPCKFGNVTASNSENNYTFINKVSCLSRIISQSELNYAKMFLSDACQPELIFYFHFNFGLCFSQMFGKIVSITVKKLERQIW